MWRGALVVAAYLAVTVLMTAPLAWRMADHTLIFPPDSLLNAWILSWDYRALLAQPFALFDANIFFPAQGTLALSEHMLANLVVSAPVMAATGNPVLAANAVVLASFVLSGAFMFVLVRSWTGRAFPAFVAGLIWAFAPPRIGQLGHMQLLSVQWLPLVVLYGGRFLRSGSRRAGVLAVVFYVLQVLSSYYVGYAVTVVLACYVAYALLVGGASRRTRTLAEAAILLLLAGAVIVTVSWPYLRLKRDFGLLGSDLDYVVALSADLARSFLSVPAYGKNGYQSLLARFQSPEYGWEKWLYPGLLPIVLALIPIAGLLVHLVRRRQPSPEPAEASRSRSTRHLTAVHALIALVCLILALGPYLVINGHVTGVPLPYLALSRLVPGFSSMRVPARFGLLALFGLSVLAGLGTARLLDALDARARSRAWPGAGARAARWATSSAIVLVLLAEFHFAPIPMDPIETSGSIPEVYRWLARQPSGGAVLEIPWAIPHDPLRDAVVRARYVYFSAYHRQPLVNGYSGYAPPSYAEITGRLGRGPDGETIAYLAALGVRRLIHHGDVRSDRVDRWQPARLRALGLVELARFGADTVFLVPAVETAPRLEGAVLTATTLPAGHPLTLGLECTSRHGSWARPPSSAAWHARVVWQDARSGSLIEDLRSFVPPLVVEAGRARVVGVATRTPTIPGRYALRVQWPSLAATTDPVLVDVREGPSPTSSDAPQLLSAGYDLSHQAGNPAASRPFALRLAALNSGRAVWLAQPRAGRGNVRLAWQWIDSGGRGHAPGREPLSHDVFPDQTYVFIPDVTAPSTPGRYTLEIGLVSEWVAWFSASGVQPLRVPLTVE